MSVRLTDQQIELYSRQIILREVGGTGQSALRAARVLLLGSGAAAETCASYLVGAGVGAVELSHAGVGAVELSGSSAEPAARTAMPLPEPSRRTGDATDGVTVVDLAAAARPDAYDVVLVLGSDTSADAPLDPLPAARLGSIALRGTSDAVRVTLLPAGSGCLACVALGERTAGDHPRPPSAIASASAGALAALVCCDWLLGIGERAGARELVVADGSGIWSDAPPPARTACPRGCPPPAEPV